VSNSGELYQIESAFTRVFCGVSPSASQRVRPRSLIRHGDIAVSVVEIVGGANPDSGLDKWVGVKPNEIHLHFGNLV